MYRATSGQFPAVFVEIKIVLTGSQAIRNHICAVFLTRPQDNIIGCACGD